MRRLLFPPPLGEPVRMFRARQLDQATFMTLEIFALALVLYFLMAQVINLGMRLLEKRLSRGRMRGGLQ